jgi:hypothetical protein
MINSPTLFEQTVEENRTKFRLTKQGQEEYFSIGMQLLKPTKPANSYDAVQSTPKSVVKRKERVPKGMPTSEFATRVLFKYDNQWMSHIEVSTRGIELGYNQNFPESHYDPNVVYNTLGTPRWFESQVIGDKRVFRLNANGLERAATLSEDLNVRATPMKKKKNATSSTVTVVPGERTSVRVYRNERADLEKLLENAKHGLVFDDTNTIMRTPNVAPTLTPEKPKSVVSFEEYTQNVHYTANRLPSATESSPSKPIDQSSDKLNLYDFSITVLYQSDNAWMSSNDILKKGQELGLQIDDSIKSYQPSQVDVFLFQTDWFQRRNTRLENGFVKQFRLSDRGLEKANSMHKVLDLNEDESFELRNPLKRPINDFLLCDDELERKRTRM